jgi:subtilisin family serine protease
MRKVIIPSLVVIFAMPTFAAAASRSISDKCIPNEIIVKLRETADSVAREQQGSDQSAYGSSSARGLQELNARYPVRQIKPLVENFQQKQEQLKSLQKKNAALLTAKQKRILARVARAAKGVKVPDLGRMYKIELDGRPGLSIEEVLQAYRSNPNVEYAERNYIVSASFVPDDPLYSTQWALDKIDAPEAWDISTGGSQVVVAVVDSGIDYNHRDLRNHLWVNEAELNGIEAVDDDQNGYVDDIYGYNFVYNHSDPMDDHGHGTHCAGIIAAGGNNGTDIAGVCWNTKIMAVKFLGSRGEGSTADAVLSVYYAVANGADIISSSWGGSEESRALQDAIDYAHSQGVITVAAAGNSNSDLPVYPASYAHVLSVAATDENDERWILSNYGDWVDIAAPGVDILSLRAKGTSEGTEYGEYTTFMTGTSMAAPHVVGACALLLSVNPLLTYARLYDILTKTADPIEPGICASDGRLNLFKAMHAVLPSRGYITLDHDYYGRLSRVGVLLADWDIKGNGSQDITLMTKEGDSETLILTETTPTLGIFAGTIATDVGTPKVEDGIVQVSHGQVIAAMYFDANDGAGTAAINLDSAVADYQPPKVSHVQVETLGRTATVEVVTDELTKAKVRCGLACGGPYIVEQEDKVVSIYHKIKLPLLSLRTDYYFVIDLVDLVGNKATADCEGLCYTFTTPEEFAGFYVPSIYSTIQAAIDDASDGDTVWVADGRYTGEGNYNIDFGGKAITVRSENGPDKCVIDCQQKDRAFHFHSGENENSVLDGFTITNGNPGKYGGGIRCTASSPTIKNCILVGNVASEYGGGMYNCYKSNPTIINCIFRGNSSESTCVLGNGGGMCNVVNSSPILIDCQFISNIASYSGGAMHNAENSSPTMRGCIFHDNSANWSGGAMYNLKDSSPVISQCTFLWNWAKDGGGAICNYYSSNPKVTNCIFSGNSTQDNGGAVKSYDSSPTLANCTLWQNSAELLVGGIWNGPSSRVTLANCILWANSDNKGTGESAQVGNADGSKISSINYCCIQGWTGDFGGIGNTCTDPRFIDADKGDFHLRSAGWRWDSERQRWDYDELTSPCIDAGNPGSPLRDEPLAVPEDPNNVWGINLRINMGAYGGTAEASMPPHQGTVLADITNDGLVTAKDFSALTSLWMTTGIEQPADLNRDRVVNTADLVLLAKDWVKYRSGASPIISITNPNDGALLQRPAGSSIEVEADAWDFDGLVRKVEFFANSTKIGQDDDGSDGWKISWQGFSMGNYDLTARATDNSGVTTVSLTVRITVIPPR